MGFRVFAGVRKSADGDALKSKASDRLSTLLLDVTSAESIAAAVKTIGDVPVAGLINNAGIVVSGPVELIPLSEWRKQFEVNVIGAIAVTQAFLPHLRNGRGRIVNIGSIGGRGSLPYGGPYCASKFALEAINDSLRMELRAWGIQVSIIEPGAIQTPIWKKGTAEANEVLAAAPPHLLELYRAAIAKMMAMTAQAAKQSSPPEAVAKAVEHALTASKPKTRYLVGTDAKVRAQLMHLPDRVMDSLILNRINAAPVE